VPGADAIFSLKYGRCSRWLQAERVKLAFGGIIRLASAAGSAGTTGVGSGLDGGGLFSDSASLPELMCLLPVRA
jgi:hypothetical protein